MKRSLFLFTALALLLLLSACADKPRTVQDVSASTIQVKDAWVRASAMMESEMGEHSSHMSGASSAAYMILTNTGDQPDRLLHARSEVAESVELHQSLTEGDVTSMKPVEAIDIPANGETELKPGGLHIMLIGLKRELKVGDTIQLTLEFEKAGELQISAEVRAP